jgi:hypothetical protein
MGEAVCETDIEAMWKVYNEEEVFSERRERCSQYTK